MQRLRKEVA